MCQRPKDMENVHIELLKPSLNFSYELLPFLFHGWSHAIHACILCFDNNYILTISIILV
jgi:hypothetical protein